MCTKIRGIFFFRNTPLVFSVVNVHLQLLQIFVHIAQEFSESGTGNLALQVCIFLVKIKKKFFKCHSYARVHVLSVTG